MRTKFIILLLFMAINIIAQVELPRLSPNASVSQTVGLTSITINYCRPAVHGRNIWGGLVPFNKVWRTGANEATTIQFTTDVTIEGNKVPAGKYSLFTIPTETEWTIILNKVDKQWGAYNYKQESDLLRFSVKPKQGSLVENLCFSVDNVANSSASIVMRWENLEVAFKVEVDLASQVYAKIKEAFAAKPDSWQNYTQAANYAAENNLYGDEPFDWIEKAISLNGGYFPYFVKAKLYNKNNKTTDALKALDKCREIGRTDKNWDSFVSQVDFLEKQIKSK
ncbi:MAG: hypothetical protein FD143_2881 [Ignavibacteria bacterium]|nr:MAG: hypothetical protein FD143_2881 [Ignavibacteria bacterium]KAF0155285.1 MAG: hypothetical protein FD188_3160 [Ignavibacteria bacterium]